MKKKIIFYFFIFNFYSELNVKHSLNNFINDDSSVKEDIVDNAKEDIVNNAEKDIVNNAEEDIVNNAEENNISSHKLLDNNLDNTKEVINKKNIESKVIAWDDYVEPWRIFDDEGAILLNFANADVINLLKYYEDLYKVIFITDDVISPVSSEGKSLIGSKINFTSNEPLSRKNAWNVLITLLEAVGVTLQPASMDRVYKVTTLNKALYSKGPLPTYIGIEPEDLPSTDVRIRYVYQVKNTSLNAVKAIFESMQSPASPPPIELAEINSILITDRIFNIKTVMSVIKEIDRATIPESMVILKLKKLEANKIADLYRTIIKEESGGAPQQPRLIGSKRSEGVAYFDPQLRVIPEPRTNSLIALGSIHSIKKFEEFVKRLEEESSKSNYIPIHTYNLKYTESEAVKKILSDAISFKGGGDAHKNGGIRDGEKYFTETTIYSEPNTNSLIIMSPDEEYRHIYNILQQIDIPQKQVHLDLIIMSVDLEKIRALGSQLRNSPGTLGKNLNAQTGVLDSVRGVVTNNSPYDNNGTSRLMGNLLELITGNLAEAGTSVITLGNDDFGVWGIIKMLVKESQAKIISNPFVLVTNKYEVVLNVGETRRIAESIITNNNNEGNSFTTDTASLQLKITPQITNDGKVFISLNISNSVFIAPAGNDISAGNKVTRVIDTSLLVSDGEMVAFGGLTQNKISESTNEVPWISQIPLIGWLFKSKLKVDSHSILLIFIKAKIINDDSEILKINQNEFSVINKKIIKEDSENASLYRWYFGENVYNNSLGGKKTDFINEIINKMGNKPPEKYKDKNSKNI